MNSRIFLVAAYLIALTGPLADQSAAVPGDDAMRTEQRLALVIGDGAYSGSRLSNPCNGARAVSQTLRLCGFTVAELLDVDRQQTLEAMRSFGQAIKRGGVALFCFAGHGVQAEGRNYLVPVGAHIQQESEVEFEASTPAACSGTGRSPATGPTSSFSPRRASPRSRGSPRR